MESNVQKMREALGAFVEYSELVLRMGMFNRDRLVAITTKARDSLLHPRNCDIGTTEEQKERLFLQHGDTTLGAEVALEWAQMPYEAKGGMS